ncbi:unnamed protein product [Phytomonas sp. Hart1]|nr:unnamed protein product [Phytomonas sp. Hart1]|eukprot:CCW67093.1 unnamed protein product [Phytomonas sp. isolate Hart1]
MSDSACHSIFYGHVMLAPMVRICHLGFRLLCEAHGAGVVFSEEIVAAKLCHCHRESRSYPGLAESNIVEYVAYDRYKQAFKRSVVFSTLAKKGRSSRGINGSCVSALVVLQLGASDGAVAAKAVTLCREDIDGVDINMGCPKKFSVGNGFGAVLMENTAAAGDILRQIHAIVLDRKTGGEASCRPGSDRFFPISFKTRLKSLEPSTTVIMLKEILMASGHTPQDPIVHAITLHARLRDQRSESPPLYDVAAKVITQCRCDPYFSGVCFVLNGSIQSRADGIEKMRHYGFNACMIARAALVDVTCFSPSYVYPVGTDHTDQESQSAQVHHMKILKEMLLFAVCYRTPFKNFKYHLARIFSEVQVLKSKMPTVQEGLRSYSDCCDFFQVKPEELELVKRCENEIEFVDSPPEDASPLLSSDGKLKDIQEYSLKKADLDDRAIQVRRLC